MSLDPKAHFRSTLDIFAAIVTGDISTYVNMYCGKPKRRVHDRDRGVNSNPPLCLASVQSQSCWSRV